MTTKTAEAPKKTKATKKRNDDAEIEQRAQLAEAYAAWLRNGNGRRFLKSPIARSIEALQWVELARDADAQTRGRVTSVATNLHKQATEEIKRLRSDATFDMHEDGDTWAVVCEILGVTRARADQVLKGVSGGKYQRQRYEREDGETRDIFEEERAAG